MTRPGHIEIGDLVSLLASQMGSLILELGLEGHKAGAEFFARNPTRADHKPGSFAIRLDGPRAGVWQDFATGDGGDALALVAYVRFDRDMKRAVVWAKRWLGLDSGDPKAIATAKRKAAADSAKRRADDAEARERKRKAAHALYLSSQEHCLGTPVDAYLRGRGLDLRRLGRWPRALRYHPRCYDGASDSHWPAMVAAVVSPQGKFLTAHRTFLKVHGDGRVTKAPLANPKKVYGPYRGGAIRLWRGERVTKDGEVKLGPQLAKAKPGETLLITEGIEDGLTVALAKPELRVMAVIGLVNLRNIRLPEAIGRVTVCADNDDGPEAREALDVGIAALMTQGIDVRIARSRIGKDFNHRLEQSA